jgi:5-methylcytosine-specific restriction protein A
MAWKAKVLRFSKREHKTRGTSAERGYGRAWQKARADYLKDSPLCVMHLARSEVEPAVVVDHIVPHQGDMVAFWDMANWQALCKRCHDRKTMKYDSNYSPMQERRRIVVCGAPGSGKTTWIESHRKPGDLVYDMDAMAAAMFQCPTYPRPAHVLDAMLRLREWCVAMANTMHCNVYLIVTDENEATEVARAINGEVVKIDRSQWCNGDAKTASGR